MSEGNMVDLSGYGYEGTAPMPAGHAPGRVTERRGARYAVMTGMGEVKATLAGALTHKAAIRADLPCVGDFVAVKGIASGTAQIAGVLPRKSYLSRSDGFGHGYAHIKANGAQPMAANFDYAFIMTSLNLDFSVDRVLRYVALTVACGGRPVVLLTKSDLVGDARDWEARMGEAAPDCPIHAVSARTGQGLGGLAAYLLPGMTSIFLGMSGVGKSSLLNALMGDEVMAVAAVRERDDRGRHKTTHRALFMLPSGGMVIDTPGMRELGLTKAARGSVGEVFREIAELTRECRFADCSHTVEPGCAVLAALGAGTLSHGRWKAYKSISR
ncbi:MAG: ribosome small subunit-dependent GTPase A [Oscillospiraceae bacterium]|nr:ribosome small subunit-dependent GTPase A [Oscillospiraceae bacterium]